MKIPEATVITDNVKNWLAKTVLQKKNHLFYLEGCNLAEKFQKAKTWPVVT